MPQELFAIMFMNWSKEDSIYLGSPPVLVSTRPSLTDEVIVRDGKYYLHSGRCQTTAMKHETFFYRETIPVEIVETQPTKQVEEVEKAEPQPMHSLRQVRLTNHQEGVLQD